MDDLTALVKKEVRRTLFWIGIAGSIAVGVHYILL